MSEIDEKLTPQIYLITPSAFDLASFNSQLSAILDTHDIACVRLAVSSTDERDIAQAADLLRETCHARDVAIVLESHFRLVDPHGLDGIHLTDSTRQVRDVREALGVEAIVGTYCGASRHAGMTAGEIGADYISFGPAVETALGSGKIAPFDLFEWWSETVEVPVVAEGNVTLEAATILAPVVDFFALGDEIWGTDDPSSILGEYIKQIS
ncbi:MAG: thiamine phosphate synthase [Amylibacter sp.]|jgi:thiamine-phosphate pyrophosphorylase